MKVTPTNQTLLLANERGPSGASALAQVLRNSSSGAVLQRVTVVASQPDASVLYLRADFSPAPVEASHRDVTPNSLPVPPPARAAVSAPNRGVALYASTQRISRRETLSPLLDVHA